MGLWGYLSASARMATFATCRSARADSCLQMRTVHTLRSPEVRDRPSQIAELARSTWSNAALVIESLERVKGIEPSSSAWKAVAMAFRPRSLHCTKSQCLQALPAKRTVMNGWELFTPIRGVTLPRRHPGGGHADKEAHRSIRRAGAAPPPMAASSTSMPHSPAWRCASPPPAARVGARSIASTADCAGSRSAPTQPSSLHKRGARQLQRSSAYGKASTRQKKSARAAIVARLRLTRLLPSLTITLNAICGRTALRQPTKKPSATLSKTRFQNGAIALSRVSAGET